MKNIKRIILFLFGKMEQQQEFLYHGSGGVKIIKSFLKPHPSKVVDGEEVVFATNVFDFAVYFAAHAYDSDIEFGVVNGKAYAMEQYPKAFELLLKNKSAMVYLVGKTLFGSDPRLGMQEHEFISRGEVQILGVVPIKDIWEYLQRPGSSINFITFDDKWEMLEPLLKKKLNI